MQVARFFFSPALDDQGEPNRLASLQDSHPAYENEMRDASAAAIGTPNPWVSQKATIWFAWMRWVVRCNLPFSFCEAEGARRFTNMPPISIDTLYGDVEKVVKTIEKDIDEEMPKAFGRFLDGWTHGTEQFNRRLARLMGVPLTGCANHRLNLAVREHLAPHEADLEKKLRTIKQAAKLRQKTSLQPVLRQDTSWSMTFLILSRYFRLYEHLSPDDDDEDLEDFTPSRSTHRSLRKLFEEIHHVGSISKILQTEGLTMLDTRNLLDGLLEVHPTFRSYLASDAHIVNSPKSESAIVKVLGGQVTRLTTAEMTAKQPFQRGTAAVMAPATEQEESSFTERILKRHKSDPAPSTYTLRLHISPMALDMVLFLKVNSPYWKVSTVDACLQ
ncbi:hypothetical protein JG687_00011671 [Phytophthora cactorum]|uniref:Uncharacterized protein n=1 Tax=Phytophthora cactorum TaxID=29920 RepID=A0A8T1U578_9STRA|nr:hypothetical protein JG687_00011671 [Phytophthora cactorum]